MNNDFRETVNKALENKNTNVNQLSKEIKISPSNIYEMLKGQRRLNETVEEKICKALGIKVIYEIKGGD